jgi:hypothetical protein
MTVLRRGRPAGAPLVIAQDALYDQPGDAWDGEDTKLRPDVLALQGQIPDQRIMARHVNWLLHDVARRLRNLDMIEISNWEIPVSFDFGNQSYPASMDGSGGNISGGITAWQPSPPNLLVTAPMYWVGGGTKILRSDDGGFVWSDDHTDAGSSTWDIDSNVFNVVAVATEGGAGKIVHRNTGAGWNNVATVLDDVRAIVADQDLAENESSPESVFWLAGINGATPSVVRWSFGADGTGAPTEVEYSAGSGAVRLDLIAVGNGRGIAASASGVVQGICAWEDGDAAIVGQGSATGTSTDAARDLLYSREDGFFFAFYDTGQVFRSATGLAGEWSELTANLPAGGSSCDFLFRGGCVKGSIIAIAGTYAGNACIFVTGDAGLTWDVLPDPLVRYQLSPQPAIERVRVAGNRFAGLGYYASGVSVAAYGLRVGRF